MLKTIIEVTRSQNENNAAVLRRFSRKVKELNIIRSIKSSRFNKRKLSKLKTKMGKLKRIETRKKFDKLKKLGRLK